MRQVAALILVAVACLFATVAIQGCSSANAADNSYVIYYQHISPLDTLKFAGARAVITAGQGDPLSTVSTIHDAGALAFSYLGAYWWPLSRPWQGVDISQHPSWRFCLHGNRPVHSVFVNLQRRVYIDLNERGMWDSEVAWLKNLKAEGYDGVFLDRGVVALSHGPVKGRVSTCTQDPVIPHASFSEMFLKVAEVARNMGLRVIFNYDPSHGVPEIVRHLAWRILYETPPHQTRRHLVRTMRRFKRAAHQTPGAIEELKTPAASRRHEAFYEWAEAALWNVGVTINSGDNNCVGVPHQIICWHYGTYPGLTKVKRGRIVDPHPRRYDCRTRIHCVWIREWQHALIVDNELKDNVSMTIHLHGCFHVRSVWTGKYLSKNCVRSIPVDIKPLSGKVYAL